MKLSIIVPVFNEEHTIIEVIKRIEAVVLPLGVAREIVVVDDGSTDTTPERLLPIAGEGRIRMVRQMNQGKTAALLSGLRQATGDIFLIQDADFEYDPKHYPALIAPILEGRSRIVYGSRFLGSIEGMSKLNRWGNWFSNKVFNALYGTDLTDINTCFKAFTRPSWEGTVITSQGFAFETEFTVKMLKKGNTVMEVPISYTARSPQQGKKMNFWAAIRMFWPIIKYRFAH